MWKAFFEWFAGGVEHPYHTLLHCMHHDIPWIAITVSLDLSVAIGYVIIAWHWRQNQKLTANTPARSALADIRNIFIFCGCCGYLFIPIKMFWPAWRLYDIVMAVLAYYTWRYVAKVRDLRVVYNELGQSQRLKDELVKSKNESLQKTAFFNAVSHDLRTPLNGIALNAQVARVAIETGDSVMQHEAINSIEASARVAAELLDGLLQCAKLDWVAEPNKESTFCLRELLIEAVHGSQREAEEKRLAVSVECADDFQICTDRIKLERVVANLVSNAVKYTRQGSVKISCVSAGQNLEVHVIDTGSGLSPEQQAYVFDEFYQVKNHERDRTKGYGLGLAIARRLVRQLGGEIELDSTLGAGSRFSIILPGVVEPRAPMASAVGVKEDLSVGV